MLVTMPINTQYSLDQKSFVSTHLCSESSHIHFACRCVIQRSLQKCDSTQTNVMFPVMLQGRDMFLVHDTAYNDSDMCILCVPVSYCSTHHIINQASQNGGKQGWLPGRGYHNGDQIGLINNVSHCVVLEHCSFQYMNYLYEFKEDLIINHIIVRPFISGNKQVRGLTLGRLMKTRTLIKKQVNLFRNSGYLSQHFAYFLNQ